MAKPQAKLVERRAGVLAGSKATVIVAVNQDTALNGVQKERVELTAK